MSYNPTNWQAGDTVTSAKLNKIEQGIKNSVLIANAILGEDGSVYLDKTWQEIYDTDLCIVPMISSEGYIVTNFVVVKSPGDEENSIDYAIALFAPGSTESIRFAVATPNDYPALDSSGQASEPSDSPTPTVK